jgi:hypothetical protein
VSRVSGIAIAFTSISARTIAVKETSCVATIESGTSWRGKRIFLISSALSSRLRAPACSDVEKKIQTASPESR